MPQQTEAQRLADALRKNDHESLEAAAELRRLEAVNAQLLEAAQAIASLHRRDPNKNRSHAGRWAVINVPVELANQFDAAIAAAKGEA